MERLITLFGGGGFLGRYVAQALLQQGARVRIAERNPKGAYFLKPQGGLGQTQFIAADITKPDSVARAVQGSEAVVNLVGVLTGRFDAVHVAGAGNVARATQEAGTTALVQISAIGADPASASAYGRSKGEGEAAVRAAFPTATIIRPSIIFGPEDAFLNRFAGMAQALPILPVIRGAARFQPVYVADAARAIAAAALDPGAHAGKTYELGGPQVMTMLEVNRFILDAIGRKPTIFEVPDGIAQLMAKAGGWLPGAPMTWDQWVMLQSDNVVAPSAAGLEAFGIQPTPLAAAAPEWLVRFRRHGRFATTESA